MKKKYYANIDSSIIKGYHEIEDTQDNNNDQTLKQTDDNINNSIEGELNPEEWTFFNQSDDYVSKVLEEIENEKKPEKPLEEINPEEWTFFNQSDDYVSKVLKELEK